MEEHSLRVCPRCGRESPLRSPACGNCGHAFRTQYRAVAPARFPAALVAGTLAGFTATALLVAIIGRPAEPVRRPARRPPADTAEQRPAAPARKAAPVRRTVQMPDLTGMPEKQVRQVMTALRMGLDVTVGHSGSVAPGAVISQSPGAGEALAEGSTVRVRVSVGPEAPRTSPATRQPEDVVAVPAPAEPAALYQPLTEAEARDVFARWLAAQNSRDFREYAKLYGEGFVGVKRTVRGKTYRFGRRDWLADRKRMMDRNPDVRVTADGLEVFPEEGGARLTFRQQFRAGDYRDWGPKELVVRREGGAVRITREDLLAAYRGE